MSRLCRRRQLRAELLESRQLLHGGGLGAAMGSGEPPAAEDVAAMIVDRLDENDDGAIDADEASERIRLRRLKLDGIGATPVR